MTAYAFLVSPSSNVENQPTLFVRMAAFTWLAIHVFYLLYNHKGVIRKYYPDFMIRLANGEYLILETKGVDNQQNKTKREFLNEWVTVVNNHGGFGKWHWSVSFNPSDMEPVLKKCLDRITA